jgi:3-carboxy-cis,cis-muconate cycloisomerase
MTGGGLTLFAGVFSRGEVAAGLDDQAWLQALLDVEAGLSRALARAGLVPEAAAHAVTSAARAEHFSLQELAAGSALTGSPVPALASALTRAVGPANAIAVHLGATSQDIVDSAMMLLAKRALPLIAADLAASAAATAQLAQRHRDSLMLGRTLLQHATPVTFGLKAAGWLHALDRARQQLAELARTRLFVQLGGAAGTLAALGERGVVVMQLMAEELGLRCPTLPWHTQRSPVLELASVLAQASSATGKIARDISLLAQSELDEVREPRAVGRGSSSTMPHKQNAIGSIAALGCSRRVPGLVATLLAAAEQEHERAAGAWHAEWETLTDLLRLVGSGASWMREVLEGLTVDTARMRQNLDAARGLPLAERLSAALTPTLGRAAAQALVADAVRRADQRRQPLLTTLRDEPKLARVLLEAGIDAAHLAILFDPADYLGSAHAFIDRALAAHAKLLTEPRNPP